MAKYHSIALSLKKKILCGDYALTNIPPVQVLAQDLGVSYATAQRAFKQLISEGLIIRRANGRFDLARKEETESQSMQIAFLAATNLSTFVEQWRSTLMRVTARTGSIIVRPILYSHWEDPILKEALDAFDGVFLLQLASPLPENTREHLRMAKKLVLIDGDLTSLGLPSIQPIPPVSVQRLLDHLEEQGHRHIDCLNAQPHNHVTQERINQWAIWMAVHQYPGCLYDEPVELGTYPYIHAYTIIRRLLEQKKFTATALVCVTFAAAVGAMRAFHEFGIRVGKDVAVCAINGENMASMMVPSLTAIESPDPEPYILRCLEWMQHKDQQWYGSLLMEPKEPTLVVRESTDFTVNVETPATDQLFPRVQEEAVLR